MTATLQVYRFDGSADAPLSEVGGKAYSLLKGSKAGLPVPPGLVLSVEFFAPWFAQIKGTAEWQAFAHADHDNLRKACSDLKATAEKLTLSAEQQKSLSDAMQSLASHRLFAVRSSSPEEDLEGTSFAGGYETVLGVTPEMMEDAVKRAFASCLDFRIVAYKREHRLQINEPKIAVVVQEQIASEIAGVGFSLNPVTNNNDQAVFNANWGQGETVVSGTVTPDTFAVDKVSCLLEQKILGKKERSIWLGQNGGTEEKLNYRSSEYSLTEQQIVQLTELINKVEQLYQKPIDIEWAFSMGKLYLLQARPITSYVPLPPDMMTKPGAKKRLYLDATISVQGIHKPLSPMGTAVLQNLLQQVAEHVLGLPALFTHIETAPAWVEWGRMYLNLSYLFHTAGRERIGRVLINMDPLAARAILQADESIYIAKGEEHPQLAWQLLWQLPEYAVHLLEANIMPEHAHQHAQQKIQKFLQEIRDLPDTNTPVSKFTDELLLRTLRMVLKCSSPLFVASRVALERMKTIAGPENEADLKKLDRALPNNVTTEMGLALYRLSQLPAGSAAFEKAWKDFMDLYGHRGPTELDIASPRYKERPELLLEQIDMLRHSSTPDDNPQKRFETAQSERHQAFKELCAKVHEKGWGKLSHFQTLYRVWETLSGYREMHKYLLIFAIAQLRDRLLKDADKLTRAGRIESCEQIFDLTLKDLEASEQNRNYDLMAAGRGNREPLDRLAKIPKLPSVIDSRGLILRPAAEAAREGEVAGTAISPGIARGRIKVLHSPDEKPLLRGEILVATATDPGWTPLFVNAAAVILEIGGMLQHGALVAREYGLPCVSGVENATTLWQDGTLVEVDGSSGIIRTIEGTDLPPTTAPANQ